MLHIEMIVAAGVLASCLASCQSRSIEDGGVAAAPTSEVGAVGATSMLVADGSVYLGGQPTRADFNAAARHLGVRTVINYRHAGELTAFDEAAALDELGVTYHHIPFNGSAELTDEVFDRSFELLQSAPRPLIIHCASGNRVGAVWMAWRMLHNGVSEEAALEEARRAGLRSEGYIEAARAFVSRRRQSGGRDQ